MEILQKCNEWLGTEPDVNTVKLKLGEVENNLSSRNAVTQLLEGWLEQLDNEVDLPLIELNLFSDDVKPSITKWLNWLTAENPDRDVVCERLKSAQKQSEQYQLAVEALVEYLGEDYVESEHLDSITASKQAVAVGEMAAPSGSYAVGSKSGSEDGSYSLESIPDKDIPSYASKEEKLSAFEALKNQLGTTTIVTNRKQIEED